MKKLFSIAFAIITSLSMSSYAQVSGGLKGGVNLTNQKWKVEFDGESSSTGFEGTSFHVGGYLNYKLSEVVSFQPELVYNNYNIDLEDPDAGDLKMNYLSLPLIFGYGFDQDKFILQAGPQLSYLISTDPSEFKDEDAINAFDFSLNIGGQVNFNKFNISVRYAIGLANIVGSELEDQLGDIDLSIKNNNLQFSVGYRLFGE
jgi:hypothetical protein